nr:hypothetical protein [Aquitalea magnusonii]
MGGDGIGEVIRPVGKAGAQQVQQQTALTGQRRIGRHTGKVAGACTAQAMDEQQRHTATGQIVIAQRAVLTVKNLHATAHPVT